MITVPPRANNGNIPTSSGIYKITCIANKRFYIGSAVNLQQRKNNHWYFLRQNKHHNLILQNAWNKYGPDAFIFDILELVLLPELLTAREQYWFEKLKPFGRKGFNILQEAGSPLGRKMPPEAIEKIRQAHLGRKRTPEEIEKLRQANLGKKTSPETREKQRQALLGRKRSPEHSENWRKSRLGRPVTEETREKLRRANLGHKTSPEGIEKIKQANLGRKHTPEAIEKMRQAALKRSHRIQINNTPDITDVAHQQI